MEHDEAVLVDHAQPYYLAAHGACADEIPTIEQLGLRPAAETARRFSVVRSAMDSFVTSPNITVPVSEDPWREIAGLCGSIGESLSICIPCEVEIALHQIGRANGTMPGVMVVAERFFAEAQAQKVIELGHRAINLGFRFVALRDDWAKPIRDHARYRKTVAQPFSQERSAWTSFTEGAAQVLADAASQTQHRSVIKMAQTLLDLRRSQAWMSLDEQRGQDFHRWRLESPVRAGVDHGSSLIRDLHDRDGNVAGKAARVGLRSYSAANDVPELVASTASDGLRSLSVALDAFLDSMLLAIEAASLGTYRWNPGKATFTQSIGRRWDDADCPCCDPQT